MSTRCKPGDIAVIVEDFPEREKNIGRLVAIRGPSAINEMGQITWLITPLTDEPYIVNTRTPRRFRLMSLWQPNIEHPDSWMTPINQSKVEKS